MSASIGLGLGGLLLATDSATDLGRWGLLLAIVGGAPKNRDASTWDSKVRS
jgi:hypothetical protein